jgi:hypothetical protein
MGWIGEATLWRVARLLPRVVRPLPRLQLIDGAADEVANLEAERPLAPCRQLLKCGVADA